MRGFFGLWFGFLVRLMVFLVCSWMMFLMLIMPLSDFLPLQLAITESIKQQKGNTNDQHDDNNLQLIAQMVSLVMVYMRTMVRSDQLIHLLYL